MSSVAKPVTSGVTPAISEPRVPWLPIAWFGGLLILCYAPVFAGLIEQWNENEDMGHGFFVPAIAGWIAWQKRHEVLAVPRRTNWLGLGLVVFGALQLWIGNLGAELFLTRSAIIESLVGIILLVAGWQVVKLLAFPLFLLVFMIPLPNVIYNQITMPLQMFASQVAATVLEFLGYPVLRDGNIIELASQRLSVVEACSGIRSLLSLSFLSLVYAWFFDPKPWMRWVLLALTVPIAIAANAGRVTVTGILSEIDPELAHGIVHTASGWVIFMIALVMLVISHQIIDRVWRRFYAKKV
jgi:exosortase